MFPALKESLSNLYRNAIVYWLTNIKLLTKLSQDQQIFSIVK